MEQINAGLLIPGRGEPVRDATVLIDGGRISYAGPAAARQPRRTRSPSPRRPCCRGVGLPGHFMGSRTLDLARLPQEPTPLRAARSARDLTNALNAGITSVREVGGLGVYLAQAVREGLLDGPWIMPRVLSSVHPRAVTAACRGWPTVVDGEAPARSSGRSGWPTAALRVPVRRSPGVVRRARP